MVYLKIITNLNSDYNSGQFIIKLTEILFNMESDM